MKKRYLAFVIGLCLTAAVQTTTALTPVYATSVDLTGDESEEGEQTTVAAPSDTQEGSTGSSSSASQSASSTGTSGQTAKSSDSSLSRLGISPGTLTPAFSPQTLNYTASVDESVSKVSIPATPNSSKAVIASVTGAKNLSVGTNTVKIVVSAENGTTTTYTITVTRGSAAASSENAQTQPQDGTETTEITGTIEDTSGSSDADQTDMAEDTQKGEVTFDEEGNLIYDGETYVTKDQVPEGEYVSLEKYNALYAQQQSEKSMYSKILIALAVGLVILLFVCVNLIFKIKDIKQDSTLDLADEEEEKRPVSKLAEPKKQPEPKNERKAEKKPERQPAEKKPEKRAEKKADRKTESKIQQTDDSDGLEILDLNDL